MRIAHVTTALINGGAEAAMFRLICADEKHSHIVISLTGSGVYEDRFKKVGIPVYCLQLKGVGLPIKPLLELRRILKVEKPDVMQGWMYHANLIGGLAARSAGIRNVFWNLRTSDPKRGEAGRVTHAINLICSRLAKIVPRKIISCAHKATKAHIQLGYPASRLQTICNGYDLEYLHFSQEARSSFRAQWQIPDDTFLIGLVARWHPQKDHRLLFEAMKTVRSRIDTPWKIMLVGTDIDSDNEELMHQLQSFGLIEDCILVGPQSDIPAVMSAMDLHVLTSKDEGFPNVIAEAMACQTPCVSTDVGDAAFIVDDTGWISPIGDVDGLTQNLYEAFTLNLNRSQWIRLSERARQRIEVNFSLESMVAQYNDVWQQRTIQSN